MDHRKIDPALAILMMMDLPAAGELSREDRMDLGFDEHGEPIVSVTIRTRGELPEVEGVVPGERVGDVVAAVVRLDALDALSDAEEVLYIAAARSGRPLIHRTRRAMGVSVTDGQRIRGGADPWDGTGVTVGVIDTGIDFNHPAFREFPGGPSRVLFYWDRILAPRPGDPAHPSGVGTLWTKAHLDQELLGPAADPPVVHPQAVDTNGHGTHCAGIAAGRGERFRGMAPGASIIAVRMRAGDLSNLPMLCQWVFDQAPGPCSINLSQGANSGGHDGTSGMEAGLDALLRDPASGDPIPGRSISVAAGNERNDAWAVNFTVPRDGGPHASVVWVSPFGNDAADELLFYYSGLDSIQVRLRSVDGPGVARFTHWVAPDALGSVEVAPAGPGAPPPAERLAPTAAGGAPVKQFNFPDGTVAFIAQQEGVENGDRFITVRIQPPGGAGGLIADGHWLLEFRPTPGTTLPGGGRVHGYIRDDAPNSDHDTALLAPSLTRRRVEVPAAGTLHQDVAIPFAVNRSVHVLVEYDAAHTLEVQARSSIAAGTDPTEWVGHGNVHAAGAGMLAPGAPVGGQLPFAPGGGPPPELRIGHSVVAGRNRLHVTFQGASPEAGICQIRLRIPGGGAAAVPVELFVEQDEAVPDAFAVLHGDPRSVPQERTTVPVHAPPALPARVRCPVRHQGEVFDLTFRVTIPRDPAGGLASVRVRMPPREIPDDVGWRFTPFVRAGQVEVAHVPPVPATAFPVIGGAAAPRAYTDGTTRVTIDYPAPGAGNPGVATITIVDEDPPPIQSQLRQGDWTLEIQGEAGIGAAPIEATVDLVHTDDTLPRGVLPSLAPISAERMVFRTIEDGDGPLAIPLAVGGFDRNGNEMRTPDRVRLELLYADSVADLRVRLRRPDGTPLGFTVGPANQVHQDPGAVAPGGGGADGAAVTASPSPGASAVILHDQAPVVAGTRRVLVTLEAAGQGAYLLHGRWACEVETPGPVGHVEVLARLASDGLPASFEALRAPTPDQEEGSMSSPGTGREILSVGSVRPNGGSVLPSAFTSAGPVRPARTMLVNGTARRWLPYAKPDLTAPGDRIASAFPPSMGVGLQVGAAWDTQELGDGSHRGMLALWPLLAGDALRETQALGAGAAETTWNVRIPAGGGNRARLVVTYPAARNLAVRIRQPAGPPNPRGTQAVDSGGAAMAIPGPGVAAPAPVPPNPDGRGQRFRLGDGTVVTIRQNGAGRAVVSLFVDGARLRGGTWSLSVRHGVPGGPAVPDVTVETVPFRDGFAWPVLRNIGGSRAFFDLPPAPAAPPNRAVMSQDVRVPGGVVRPVVLDVHHPPVAASGPTAGNFRVLVGHPNGQQTRSLDNAGGNHNEGGAIAGAAVAGGRRFGFADNTRATIVHDPALNRFRITLERDGAANGELTPGNWTIFLLNFDPVGPAAFVQYRAFLTLHPFGHEAPFFLLPGRSLIEHTYLRRERLAAGTPQQWDVYVPEARRAPLDLEVVYLATDTVQVQAVMPDGENSGLVGPVPADAPVAASQSANFAAGVATPDGVRYVRAGQVRVTISNRAHPSAPGRRLARIRLEPDGPGLLPAGVWRIGLNPTAVPGASTGVCEAWLPEGIHQRISGTSMATPHVVGVAGLLLQQDHGRTHDDVRRLLLSTARPLAQVHLGARQLPGQWDPGVGWGVLNASEALLGHAGGLRHNEGAAPAAQGRTTGCPVACDDNCLLEAVGPSGAPTDLVQARGAPHNRAAASVGGDPLPGCPRLAGYLGRFHDPARGYTGAEGSTFEAAGRTALHRPLLRDAGSERGTLAGFRAVDWDDALAALAERFVEHWLDSGEIFVVPGRPDAGVVREVVFNRWMHHMHDLLTASNKVSKCAFSTKSDISQVSPRVPFGSLFTRAAFDGIRGVAGEADTAHDRGDLSLTRSVVLWGVNLAAAAPGLLRHLQALKNRLGDRLHVLAVDPGVQDLPPFVRRVAVAPGSDRELALALMLRIVGNPAAAAPRDIPENPHFADATRGIRTHLETLGDDFSDFVDHVRSEAATFLRHAGGVVTPDDALVNRCVHPTASAEAALAPFVTRFAADFEALFRAYMDGPTATILGTGPSRHLEGEEQVQYVSALALVSGNVGVAGGGVSFGEDRHARFNGSAFAGTHDSLRPHEDVGEMGSEEVQEQVNLASMGADASERTRVALWFDADPLTHLPDPDRVEALLRANRLNVQVASSLDDSTRFADIVLPMADTLQSYDLQMTKRSPWINLTQPVRSLDDAGPRPMARILHDIHRVVRARIAEDYHDDLMPVIDRTVHRVGPVVLPADRRTAVTELLEDPNRMRNLLVDRLPGDEASNICNQIRAWYTGLHDGQPTASSDEGVTFDDGVAFFHRVQVDWIVELLLARYSEREVPLLLYNLLQRGTVLDPHQFTDGRLGVLPEGATPRARAVFLGQESFDLRGSDGFEPERDAYRTAVRAQDGSATGRAAFPMRLVVAQSPRFDANRIPLADQVNGGAARRPVIVLNPASPSVAARGLTNGDRVSLVGNVAYGADTTYETVLAHAEVRVDDTMALETVLMEPGWHGLDRGGQRVARGIHSEEGEVPALFDNLVRIADEGHAPTRAENRGASPRKR